MYMRTQSIRSVVVGVFSLLFFFFFTLVSAASADTTGTVLPTSDGNYLQWTPKSGGTHYTQVDETVCNGTTDYVSTATTGNRDSFGVSLSTVPDSALITQVAIVPCASRNSSGGGSATLNVFYRFNGVNSADQGAYALPTGTTPASLATTTFSSLAHKKTSTSTFEIGAIYTSGTKGIRLGREAVVITYTPIPTAPSSLSASAVSSSQINLSWTDNSGNETGFEIDRSTDGTNFSLASTTGAGITAFNDTGLSASTLYYYRVRATNGAGDSANSNTSSATTLGNPPSNPTGLSATAISANRIDLVWTDASSDETGFKVERSTGGSWTNIATTTANVISYSSTGLATSTQYLYRVRAYNGDGNSGYSNTASATTTNGAPTAPSNLSGTASTSATQGDSVLTWTDNSSDETTFKIERSSDGTNYSQIGTVGANVTTRKDANLANGTYYYRVRAANGSLNSGYTNTATVTIAVTLPDAPTDLTAVATSSGTSTVALLNWTDNATNETSYWIEWGTNGTDFSLLGIESANVESTEVWAQTGATNYYRIRAVNGGGGSDPSNVDSFTI